MDQVAKFKLLEFEKEQFKQITFKNEEFNTETFNLEEPIKKNREKLTKQQGEQIANFLFKG